MPRPEPSLDELVAGVLAGDRRLLAQAITCVESTRPEHGETAQALLERVHDRTGEALRVGVTGVPGVGKSTFIEALGLELLEAGKRVAVLAVDPTSARSGGSILGDKTRMARLSRDPRAFIRPSPGAGSLGGVARRTREALLLCEAAGFDVVLVETIGVGQSEVAVADMVDCFLLLALARAGDELQGIKRGIMELADVVAVTKCDGDNVTAAERAATQLRQALHLLRPSGEAPAVLTCSSLERVGVTSVWEAVVDHVGSAKASGALEARRREQSLAWLDDAVDDLLRERFQNDERVRAALPELRRRVRQGLVPPTAAARELLRLHFE